MRKYLRIYMDENKEGKQKQELELDGNALLFKYRQNLTCWKERNARVKGKEKNKHEEQSTCCR